jgi:hypothetical protein
MYMQRTTSGAAGNGLYTTIMYDQALATHNERHRGKRPGRSDEVPATHNERRREQLPEHHDHPLL